MSPKIQLFLAGSLVALFSFVFIFAVSGGVAKLQRMHRAGLVEQQNQQYLLTKQKEEAKKKPIEAVIVSQPVSPETGTVPVADNSAASAPASNTSTQAASVTVEQLVQKYQNVLDLNADPEWKNYPVELRRHAYAIMSQRRVEQQNASQKTESNTIVPEDTKAVSPTPEQAAPTHTGIDSIFIDGTGAVSK